MIPETKSMVPANIKSGILCSDSQISCGTLLTRPASEVPAPSATISTGRAQQISVLKEPNKVSVETNPVAMRFLECAIIFPG